VIKKKNNLCPVKKYQKGAQLSMMISTIITFFKIIFTMKNFSLFSLMTFCLIVCGIYSCNKDESMQEIEKSVEKTEIRTNSFTSSEFKILDYVRAELDGVDDVEMINFMLKYGVPVFEKAFQKRNSNLNVTTIPVMKGNTIGGIFKAYETTEGQIGISFFPKSEINDIIEHNTSLDNEDFGFIKGAIQSFALCEIILFGSCDNKYYQWLTDNKNRLENRVAWFCIEEWECILQNLGGPDPYSIFVSEPLNDEIWDCSLLYRECWVDYTQRSYVNYIGKGGSISNPNPGTGGNTGSGSKDEDTGLTVEEEIALYQCLAIASPEVKEFLSQDLYKPCSNSQTNIAKLMYDLCKKNQLNEGNILSELEDGIIVNLNEFPIEGNDCSKTEKQNLEDFAKFVRENGGCSKEGIKKAIEMFLGLSSTIPEGSIPFSAHSRMCDKILKITPSTNNPFTMSSVGLHNLSIALDGIHPFNYDYLTLNITNPTNCNMTISDIFTNAFNEAITMANTNIANGNPINFDIVNVNYSDHRMAFLAVLSYLIKKTGNDHGCVPEDKIFTLDVNVTNSPSKSFDCAPIFVDLTDSKIRELCP